MPEKKNRHEAEVYNIRHENESISTHLWLAIDVIHELDTVLGFRNRASFITPKPTVAIAGDQLIESVTDGPGQNSRQRTDSPNASQVASGSEDGVEFAVNSLVGCSEPGDQDYGVELSRIEVVLYQDISAEVSLQSGIAKAVVPIEAEQELDNAVAKSADAVVEDKGVAG